MLNRVRLTTLLLTLSAAAFAQGGDPPSRVARLSYQSGSVSFRPGTVDEWSAASINYPLTTGDHLWTDAGAQTEVHVGGNAVRMSSETALSFLNLDDRTVQISVTQGSVQIHLRSLEPDGTFEIDTPNAAVTLLRAGDYRLDADGDNNLTMLTVRGGDAVVTAGGEAFTVHARETARIGGTDTVSHDISGAIALSDFERWCDARDRREEQSVSAQYVPRDMTGYEDLDDYGSWREERDYGWVWAPRTVAVGWAPYRDGHWAWVEPWGWTWIDDAPWGFAPFHYGRWAQVGGLWVWAPGRRVVGVRPVYAPALVVFVGGGGRAAWFPLGPGEVYRPAYHTSSLYVRNVNVTHVTNVTVINNVNVVNERYVNRRLGAVTGTSNDTFAGGRHIGAEGGRIDAREIDRTPVVGFAAPIPPRRESVVFGRGAAPPARIADRTVVVRNAPPAAPVSFGTRQRALEANQGRPLDPSQVESLRSAEPARRPMVRTAQPARAEEPRRVEQSPVQPQLSQPSQRNDRPGRGQMPIQSPVQPSQPQPSQAQPRTVETPRQIETPRRVEQQPRQVEPPRRIEQPRPEQTGRPVEQQRRQEPRTETPRPAESPERPGPPRGERQAAPERPQTRREAAQPRKEERKAARKEEKKDQ